MKKHFRTGLAAVLAAAVTLTSCPICAARAADAAENNQSAGWAADIASMLDGREYVEGEVLAIYDNSACVLTEEGIETQKLAEISDDAVENVIDADLEDSENAASVRLVSEAGKTTKEILEELSENPAVVYAEPNYTSSAEDITIESEKSPETEAMQTAGKETAGTSDASAVKKVYPTAVSEDLISTQGYDQVGDLSRLQWGYTEEASEAYSIHSPLWNTTGVANTDGSVPVVAVIDSGIDTTHPEFEGIIADMTQYSSLGGRWGYNCSTEGEEDDVTDLNGHGTHCAGIIAAKWDGTGTSGVASGVQLCVVKASVNGEFRDVRTVKAFMYLIDAVKNGMNLYSVNCSFGGDDISNVIAMMVNALGEQGVVTCFASGNTAYDNDSAPNTSASAAGLSCAITVNAANTSAEPTDYSHYGAATTDLFSPGDAILAPVASNKGSYIASIDENRQTYDGFDGTGTGVKVAYLGKYDVNEYTDLTFPDQEALVSIIRSAQEAGSAAADTDSFDEDGYSCQNTVPALTSTDERAVYLISVPIDEEKVQNIKYVSVAVKSTLQRVNAWVTPFMFYTAESDDYYGSVTIDLRDSSKRPSNVWTNMTVSLRESQESTALPYYNGCIYLAVVVKDLEASGEESQLYIDSVGAGNSELRYTFLEGTSMATPAITGAVAVLYSQLMAGGELEGLTPAERATFVADRMKAKTVPNDSLQGKCTSNGAFDFLVTDYTPVVHSISVSEGGIVSIAGDYFGDQAGTLSIGGHVCEINAWSDDDISAVLPDGLTEGQYSYSLTAANGKSASGKVIVADNPSETLGSYDGRIDIPEELAGCRLKLTALNGILYAFPETAGDNYSNTVIWNTLWAYNLKTDTWRQCADLPISTEARTGLNNEMNISVNAYRDFVVAQIDYRSPQGSEKATMDEIFLYYPETDTWTEVIAEGACELPFGGITCGCDEGLFYFGGNRITGTDSETGDPTQEASTTIYRLEVDEAAVRNQAASVLVEKLTEAGEGEVDSFGYDSVSSCGSDILFSRCQWFRWDEKNQEFRETEQSISEIIGDQHDPVCYIAQYTATLTPAGAIVAALNGDNIVHRGYDTFYFREDGTMTSFGKYAMYADLYHASSCYSDGILYVWGDTYYGEEKTQGYLTYVSVPASTETSAFVDVNADDYCCEAVRWAAEHGIAFGVDDTHFVPDGAATRAQMITFLYRAAGSPEVRGASSGFTDVEAGSYYEKAVIWAAEQGITFGTTATTFSPNETVTRAQAVTFLARMAGAEGTGTTDFTDVPTDSDYAAAVAWAASNHITAGTSATTFSPEEDCLRGQIVTFLYRYFVQSA